MARAGAGGGANCRPRRTTGVLFEVEGVYGVFQEGEVDGVEVGVGVEGPRGAVGLYQ